jgi:deoxyribose-phosphate aldolase
MSEGRSLSSTSPSLDLAIRCIDLTSLDGEETKEQVLELCDRAVRPDPEDASIPSVAAVVLYASKVSVAADRLGGTGVLVASVAGFPGAEGRLEDRLAEIRRAVADGADEVDIVLNRPLFLAGSTQEAAEEIRRAREAAGSSTLKVILETGELQTSERIREAAMVAMQAGAQFIKSSTGKVASGVTPESALVMMEAARDFQRETGAVVGIKVSGGVRTAQQAMRYLDLLESTLGPEWLTPDRFRIGASSLLDDIVTRARAEPMER